MRKIYAICMALVLFLSAGAFATFPKGGIGQTECFELYGENMVSQIGSQGSSVGCNMASVDQDQKLTKVFNTKLTQSENSMLTQNANTSGGCGSFDVTEKGGAEGDQSQLLSKIGHKNVTKQDESLEVGLYQNANKDGGFGSADGAQCIVSDQSQSIVGKGIKMNESQFIGAAQYADVSGKAWSDAEVTNYISVTADQSQTCK